MSTSLQKTAHSQHIGNYEILGPSLASGGLARVYKVRSPDGKIRAAKVMGEEYLKDRKKKDRFCSEFQILSRLNSPRIIKAIELISEKKTCALILEYVEGIELSHLLKKAPFPEEVTLYVVMEISLAFQECHKHQLFHRDLKPENILISRKGHIKLIDFGVAKDPDLKRTQQGTVLGTLEYMAPEQISGTSNSVDQRADLYALGVITFEMLSRRLPIKISPSDNILNVLKKKEDHKIPKGKLTSSILENFCQILTHPDPEERPQSVEEILEFIKKYKKVSELKTVFKNWIESYWAEMDAPTKPSEDSKARKIKQDAPPPAVPPYRKSRFLKPLFLIGLILAGILTTMWEFPEFLSKVPNLLTDIRLKLLEFSQLLVFFFS